MLRPTDLRPVSSPQGCSSKTYAEKVPENDCSPGPFFASAPFANVSSLVKPRTFWGTPEQDAALPVQLSEKRQLDQQDDKVGARTLL